MFGEFFLERGLTNFQSWHLGKRPLLMLDLAPEIRASGAHSFSDLLAKRLPDFNRIIALQLNYGIGKGKKNKLLSRSHLRFEKNSIRWHSVRLHRC